MTPQIRPGFFFDLIFFPLLSSHHLITPTPSPTLTGGSAPPNSFFSPLLCHSVLITPLLQRHQLKPPILDLYFTRQLVNNIQERIKSTSSLL